MRVARGGAGGHGRGGCRRRRAASSVGWAGVRCLRGRAGSVGVGAGAGAARPGGGAPPGAASPWPLFGVFWVRPFACVVAGRRLGAAGRCRHGDWGGVGGQGRRAWASRDRRLAGSAVVDGAGLAAAVRRAGRADAGGVDRVAGRAGRRCAAARPGRRRDRRCRQRGSRCGRGGRRSVRRGRPVAVGGGFGVSSGRLLSPGWPADAINTSWPWEPGW